MKWTFKSCALAAAIVAGVAATHSALAADNPAAEARARAHITDFPGRSLHGPDHSYTAKDAIVDANGDEHVRFERHYRGLRVIGGDLVVHSTGNGTLLDVSRTLDRTLMLDASARCSCVHARCSR